jgi:hypothetical protein
MKSLNTELENALPMIRSVLDGWTITNCFTKCAIEQPGIWSSPGGKYKKFTGSKSDLTYTWNYESGMLTFHGKVGKQLKDLLIYMCARKESTPADRAAEIGSEVRKVKDNCLVTDFANLSGAEANDKQSMYASRNSERDVNTADETMELFNVPQDNSISASRPNNKYPHIKNFNECSNVCDCLCKESLENIKLDLEILRSQVGSLQSLANSQEACLPVINDFVRLQIELSLTKISHNISYMKISYMKSLYGIETNFMYEIFHI